MYKFIEKNNIKILKFDIIESFGITKHYYSSRKGGISPSPFDSLNLGLHTTDKSENVITNRKLLEETSIL
jgi:copper oxidase (laccase) domain-containing protein